MYHNWYELYVISRQKQKDLYRRADEARLLAEARRSLVDESLGSRKERRKQARSQRCGRLLPRALAHVFAAYRIKARSPNSCQ